MDSGGAKGKGPTLYPVACSPQAWAAGSVFMVLQAMPEKRQWPALELRTRHPGRGGKLRSQIQRPLIELLGQPYVAEVPCDRRDPFLGRGGSSLPPLGQRIGQMTLSSKSIKTMVRIKLMPPPP